ncbi:GTPase Era [Gaoshiqia sediminis]|uniref:GTPase Era n=1 Tax=Gaoshiqia sediminis TaxID=2986998 RepID=A0AA41YDR6_9BACT|nr:GTPase Era [Gaoshiqia sediminis]MCW0483612.1 GTPase Era [Gaoshiqia sediminis]
MWPPRSFQLIDYLCAGFKTFIYNQMAHKSGFVNIIGNPNVGKSTIMNALVGERLSIITKKMQTTRHRIKGIVSGEDFQIVYSDTPGILKPNYKLQESMMSYVHTALIDADVILYVTDVVEQPDKNSEYLEKIRKSNAPVMVLINKIDLSNQGKVIELYDYWKNLLPAADVFAISATEKFNIAPIFDRIIELLPEGPPYFPKDELTDRNERFFVTEIIREKILLHYQKEVPYSVEVEVEEFKEEAKLLNLRCVIHVARDSQKGIIIGHQGKALKKVATEARLDLEEFFQKKIFMELYVKVTKDWRDKDRALGNFGYDFQ